MALLTSCGRDAVGEQLLGVEVDADLAAGAAVGQREGSALHHGQLLAHPVDAVVVQLGLAVAVAAEGHLQDGNGAGVVADDERGHGAGGHAAEDGLGDAVTWAVAEAMSTSGWNDTLITATPLSVWLSIFLMLETAKLVENSENVVICRSISSVDRPE
jgi:hypothetical protein